MCDKCDALEAENQKLEAQKNKYYDDFITAARAEIKLEKEREAAFKNERMECTHGIICDNCATMRCGAFNRKLKRENEKLEAELKPLRECYGPAGMKAVSKFIEERDAAIRELATFRWVHVPGKQEAKQFYESLLPRLKEAAKECGYALAVHGSLIRDLDLIATPWIDKHTDREILVRSLHRAACGIESQSYTWEQKPGDREAVSFPICWPEWNEPNAGHIDLSVVGLGLDRALREVEVLRDACQKVKGFFITRDPGRWFGEFIGAGAVDICGQAVAEADRIRNGECSSPPQK